MGTLVQALHEVQQMANLLLEAMEHGDKDLIEYRRQHLQASQERYFRICSRHIS